MQIRLSLLGPSVKSVYFLKSVLRTKGGTWVQLKLKKSYSSTADHTKMQLYFVGIGWGWVGKGKVVLSADFFGMTP